MNIAIGKLSKSVRFDKEYRKAGKGDLAPMASYIALAKKYPEHNFYVIGPSDLYKSAETEYLREKNEIPSNIIDICRESKERLISSQSLKKVKNQGFSCMKKFQQREYQCEYVIDILNERNIHIDYGIFFIGPDLAYSTPWCYKVNEYTKTGKKINVSLLDMSRNYSSQITHACNTLKFPFILVNEDPRYVPFRPRDFFHDETCILSHIDSVQKVKRISGYFDQSLELREVEENYIYSAIERTSLYFLKKYDFRNKDGFEVEGKKHKKDGFMFIACNESPSRFKNIKNWVLDQFEDVKIYGKWSDDTIKGYEDRFQNTPMAYLQDELWRSKYTYIPGFFDNMTNFVTIKIWEMMIYGVIPFFDVSKYDTDKKVPVPEFFRCTSPEDMKEKINQLENDPELYNKYLNEMYDLVKDDYFNGEFICKIFDPIFKKEGKNITIEDWRENAKNLDV